MCSPGVDREKSCERKGREGGPSCLQEDGSRRKRAESRVSRVHWEEWAAFLTPDIIVSFQTFLIQFFFFFHIRECIDLWNIENWDQCEVRTKSLRRIIIFIIILGFFFLWRYLKIFLNRLKIISRKWDGRGNCINEISNNFEKINEIRNMRRWKQRAKSITEGDEKWWRWKGIKWNKKGK